MSRPEWVTCIAEEHQDRIGQSLCGRTVGFAREVPATDPVLLRFDPDKKIKVLKETESVFMGLRHWYLNAIQGGRLQGCEDCLSKVMGAIKMEERLE